MYYTTYEEAVKANNKESTSVDINIIDHNDSYIQILDRRAFQSGTWAFSI